jgi:hypothetical protein
LEGKRKSNAYFIWPVRQGQWFHPDPTFPVNLGKTGQKNSWHPGDDGALRTGVAWPSPRFTDHEDGTVTDNLTGLMWLKDADCFGMLNWPTALQTVNQFNLDPTSFGCHELTATYGDWRLPNRKEYPSLIDHSVYPYGFVGRLPLDHPFENLSGYNYWTSTTVEATTGANKSSAYSFNLGQAIVSSNKWTYYHSVWPVRGWTTCHGDCDGDGDVDGIDLVGFLVDFMADNPAGVCSADFNEDGHIDSQDLARFAANLGRTNCPVPD